MVRLDPIADALATLKNAEMAGKDIAYLYPVSKLLLKIIEILKKHGYIEDYEKIESPRGTICIVKLKGRIHNIGAIKPRFPVKWREIEEWEKKYLPSYAMGLLIISTSKGVMTNIEAKEKRIGGRLIAYVY